MLIIATHHTHRHFYFFDKIIAVRRCCPRSEHVNTELGSVDGIFANYIIAVFIDENSIYRRYQQKKNILSN